ncbi:ribokinase isoform X2 [Halyomorpha halys]|uniref:ribokinase isoform X2 n=1 Tax=Halyomorpha halys TaxID=286706 RepID=UPI0006D520A6|nr:ribokinase-like isoform X2 [Halyomorpha halys]
MANQPDIVVFGSCMVDLTCYCPRLPLPGETIHGTDFRLGNGGKGANQCVAATKLGGSTALIARLGNDSFGQKYKAHLTSMGINTQHVTLTDDITCGMAQITVSENGENAIVIVAGANKKLSLDDAKRAENFLMKSKVVLFQFETPVESTIQTLEFISSKGGPLTIVNGAPALENVNHRLFELCDVFCVNETEGAGDVFIGALAYLTATLPNTTLSTRISRACSIASVSVMSKGTQSSFPFRKDLPSELFVDDDS